MDRVLAQLVRERAGNACEYCRLSVPPYHIEHITAKQHGGPTIESNLALACVRCNSHKGPNLSGIDPVSGNVVRLFHPRLNRWTEHFRWQGAELLGQTPEARATIAVLDINHPLRIEVRQQLIAEGRLRVE